MNRFYFIIFLNEIKKKELDDPLAFISMIFDFFLESRSLKQDMHAVILDWPKLKVTSVRESR